MDTAALVPLTEILELGKVLAQSGFFDDSRQAAQAVVKILAGREIGVGPIAAMTGIHIIKGKPAIGSGLIASAIKRSGRYNYRIRKHDTTICEIEFFERTNDNKWESIGVSTFTIEDAHKAGTQNLERFARNMLFARAISNGARWYTPDIFGGPVYTPEELGMPVDGEGEIIDAVAHVSPHVVDDADTEFDAMPSASSRSNAPALLPNSQTNKSTKAKLAVIKTAKFFDLAALFASAHPHWQNKNGDADSAHICATAAKLGFAEITNDNIDEVFRKLEQAAISKEADEAAVAS